MVRGLVGGAGVPKRGTAEVPLSKAPNPHTLTLDELGCVHMQHMLEKRSRKRNKMSTYCFLINKI